jgi:hypothetical protein
MSILILFISLIPGAIFCLPAFNRDLIITIIAFIIYVAIVHSINSPSRLGWWNWVICQWFFFRICQFCDDFDNVSGYGILFPIIPLTGWDSPISSDFYPKKFRRIRLWMEK